MNTTLVIMAAGIGSRFGGGIKQLASIGPCGEIIMDYSIRDAIKAGFNKIIFIIRKDIEADFREVIGDRIEAFCSSLGVEVAYAYQSLEDIPSGFTLPAERQKPWGTGQAVLSCKGLVNEPFAVINADDYYGKEAFVKIHDFLINESRENQFCMAGFILKNTLSENGAVTRGICRVDADGYLTDVDETSGIVKTETGAAVDGAPVDADSYVSMNMWGLMPGFLDTLEEGFTAFFETSVKDNPLMAEFLLPIYIDQLLNARRVTVKVLETKDRWYGVTYKEDLEVVRKCFQEVSVEDYRE